VETYSTIQCNMKVSDRVYTSQQKDAKDIPSKYIIKDSNGKLLCFIVFKSDDADGITDDDLVTILKDRKEIQERAK